MKIFFLQMRVYSRGSFYFRTSFPRRTLLPADISHPSFRNGRKGPDPVSRKIKDERRL